MAGVSSKVPPHIFFEPKPGDNLYTSVAVACFVLVVVSTALITSIVAHAAAALLLSFCFVVNNNNYSVLTAPLVYTGTNTNFALVSTITEARVHKCNQYAHIVLNNYKS